MLFIQWCRHWYPHMELETWVQIIHCFETTLLYPISQRMVFTLPETAEGWKNWSCISTCYLPDFKRRCGKWCYPWIAILGYQHLSWDGELEHSRDTGNLGLSFTEQSLYFIHFCRRNEQRCLVLYGKAVICLVWLNSLILRESTCFTMILDCEISQPS